VPAILLHQNMRKFAGEWSRRPERVRAYLGQPPPQARRPRSWRGVIPAPRSFGFPGIAAGLGGAGGGPRTVAIAGFTELTNEPGARAAVERLARALMGVAPSRVELFNCGITMVSRRRAGRRPILVQAPEYLALAIAPGVELLALGRVPLQGDLAAATTECEGQPFACPWRLRQPPLASAEYRFVCYAVVELSRGAEPIAVGFVHNTFTLASRQVTSGRLPTILGRIRNNPVETPSVVYVGGDFNVAPPAPPRPNARFPLWPYSDEIGPATPLPFPGGAGAGTTAGGNTYDWWVADRPPVGAPPVASISTLTFDGREGLMSDHVAILLTLP